MAGHARYMDYDTSSIEAGSRVRTFLVPVLRLGDSQRSDYQCEYAADNNNRVQRLWRHRVDRDRLGSIESQSRTFSSSSSSWGLSISRLTV